MMKTTSFSSKAANLVLIMAALCGVVLLTYAVIRRPFLSDTGFKVYATASVLGTALCLFALRLPPGPRAKVALMLVSIGIAVYGLELAILLTAGERVLDRERAVAAGAAGVPYDARSKREVVADLRRDGVEAYPTCHPSLLTESDGLGSGTQRLYPLGGIALKTTVFCNESGSYTIYVSDEHGFNNPTGLWSGTAIDVVLIGDSYVQGAAVDRPDTLAGQLRTGGLRAISLGIGGNGPLIELATIKEYAAALRPRVVVWAYHEGTDLPDLEAERESPLLRKYLKAGFSQNLLSRQEDIDRLWKDYVRELEGATRTRKNILDFIKLFHLRVRLGQSDLLASPDMEPPPRLMQSILETARATVAGWGGRLYFAYLPDWHRYAGDDVDHATFASRRELLDMVREAGVPVIDVHERVMASHPDPLSLFPFRIFGHFNAEGYALIAESLASQFRSDGIPAGPGDNSPAPPQ